MTQAFLTYGFPATGASIDRTMPARLNDIINVKDWGATGDGVTDDTAAIQAAVDYAWDLATVSYRPHGTIVFFPAGTYRIDTGPLNVHNAAESYGGGSHSLSLKGAGMDVSILRGTYDDGFLVQKLSTGFSCSSKWGNISDLTIWNESTASGSGAFLMESHGGINYADSSHFKGVNGFWWIHDVYSFSFSSCKFTSSIDANSAASATYWPPRGSVGVWPGSGDMVNCRIEGFDVGLVLTGSGGSVYGCTITKCNVGIYTGLTNALTSLLNPQGDGLRVMSNRIERCGYGAYAFNGPGTFTSSNVIVGTDGVRNAAVMTLSWSSDLVTATVAGGHNLQVNEVQKLAITPEATGGTFSLNFGGDLVVVSYDADATAVQAALESLSSIGSGNVSCTGGPFPWPIYIEFTGTLGAASQSLITVVDSVTDGAPTITQVRDGGTTVSLLLVTSPAAWTPDDTGTQIVSCTRTSATQFTYARTGNPGSFTSATWNYALARGIAIRNGAVTTYACNVLNALVPTDGSFDLAGATDASSSSGDIHKALCMCHHATYGWTEPNGNAAAGWNFIACNRAATAMTYTNLPSNTSVGETLRQEGMEYTITNGTPSSAAFGATITAGPPNNHYKVRWDGTNWVRVG